MSYTICPASATFKALTFSISCAVFDTSKAKQNTHTVLFND